MDIRQLDYFIAVASTGSFTKAAESLFVTRQAVSKSILNLENEIGSPLLRVEKGEVDLTETGREFHSRAVEVSRAFHLLESEFAKSPSESRRQGLPIALSHGSLLSLDENVIGCFKELYPDILFSVEEGPTDSALEMVSKKEAEIGLVGSLPLYLSEFDWKLIKAVGTYVSIPLSNPLSEKPKIGLADLSGQPMITFGKRNHLHRFFLDACKESGVEPDILMTTSNRTLLMESASKYGALYFCFPSHEGMARENGRMVVPLEIEHADQFGTYLVKRKESRLSFAAQAFSRFLIKKAPQ